MIKVLVKTNTTRQEVITEVTKTPAQVFEEANAGVSGAMVNLNGTVLTATDLNSTFEHLGVADGATVNLNSIVKADGAR